MNWPVIIALIVIIPIVIIVPVMVWAAVVSGLYQVALDALRRRSLVLRRRPARVTK